MLFHVSACYLIFSRFLLPPRCFRISRRRQKTGQSLSSTQAIIAATPCVSQVPKILSMFHLIPHGPKSQNFPSSSSPSRRILVRPSINSNCASCSQGMIHFTSSTCSRIKYENKNQHLPRFFISSFTSISVTLIRTRQPLSREASTQTFCYHWSS
ncbi:hypothetical protein DEU56DRAFT_327535 [Suillus clintonianus]|uniref:uncharacterized protein n=1 Tax=Suillus clintonianus TaxID=1904413 RepID=UPI001B882EA0|nr:uncharacterized protein DEU56DRAFT_327535 [Suillus clintonianus]KAG2139335.1 hypothetical protein DEU56DRAFT_327535 [Suillus clintonianus]